MSRSSASNNLALELYDLRQKVERVGSSSQLANSSVGGQNAVPLADTVVEAAFTNAALPVVQDDVADVSEGVSDLQESLAAMDEDLDARLEQAGADLEGAQADLLDAMQDVSDAFDVRLDGMSEDIDTAIKSAAGKPLILFSKTAGPSGTAPTGSTWFLIDTAENIAGQWQQTGTEDAPEWTPRAIASDVVANLDVGKLTAGHAAIAQLVAQKIAASTANFQTVNVGNLFVTSGATMQQAVIDYLFANVVAAKKITASMIDVNSLNGVTITGAIIKTAATGARTILSGTSIKFVADNEVDGGSIAASSNGSTRSWMKLGQNQRALVLGPYDLPVAGTVSGYIDSLYVGELYVNNEYDAGTNFRTSGSDSGWRNLPFASGTSAYGDGLHPVQYRMIGKRVELRGWWQRTSGNITAGLIGTLPQAFRPPYDVLWNAATNGAAYVRTIITQSGQINALAMTSTTLSYSSLDLASFYLND